MHLTAAEAERFTTKYEVLATGCWRWTGPLDKDGYGSFYLRRKNRRAHRVGRFMAHGPIPAGMVVNHTCGLRSCVNPQHLNVLTPAENSLRDSRSVGYVNSQKTVCPQGHPYDLVRMTKTGPQRVCTICEREKSRRLRRKWAAEDTLAV